MTSLRTATAVQWLMDLLRCLVHVVVKPIMGFVCTTPSVSPPDISGSPPVDVTISRDLVDTSPKYPAPLRPIGAADRRPLRHRVTFSTGTPVNVSAATVLDVNGNPIVGGRIISQDVSATSSSSSELPSCRASLSTSSDLRKVFTSQSVGSDDDENEDDDDDDDMEGIKNSIVVTSVNDVTFDSGRKSSQIGYNRSGGTCSKVTSSQQNLLSEDYVSQEESRYDSVSGIQKRSIADKGKVGNGRSSTSSRRKKSSSWSKHRNSRTSSSMTAVEDWNDDKPNKSLFVEETTCDEILFHDVIVGQSAQNSSRVSAGNNDSSFTVVPARSKKGKGSNRQQNGRESSRSSFCPSQQLSPSSTVSSRVSGVGKHAAKQYSFVEDLHSSEELPGSLSDVSMCDGLSEDWSGSTGLQTLSSNYSLDCSLDATSSKLFYDSTSKNSTPLASSVLPSSMSCHDNSLPESHPACMSVPSSIGISSMRVLTSGTSCLSTPLQNSACRNETRSRKSKIFLDTRIDDSISNQGLYDITFGFDDSDSVDSRTCSSGNSNNGTTRFTNNSTSGSTIGSLNRKNCNSKQASYMIDDAGSCKNVTKVDSKAKKGTKGSNIRTTHSTNSNMDNRTASNSNVYSRGGSGQASSYSTSTYYTEPIKSQKFNSSIQGCTYLSSTGLECSADCSVQHGLTFTVGSELQQQSNSLDVYNMSPLYHNPDTSNYNSCNIGTTNLQPLSIHQSSCDNVLLDTYSSTSAGTSGVSTTSTSSMVVSSISSSIQSTSSAVISSTASIFSSTLADTSTRPSNVSTSVSSVCHSSTKDKVSLVSAGTLMKPDRKSSDYARDRVSPNPRDLSVPISESLKKNMKTGRVYRGRKSGGFNLWEAQTFLYQAFSGVKQELGMR